MRSAVLRWAKSLWSSNPLPSNCSLYIPFWALAGSTDKSVDLYGYSYTISGSAPVRTTKGWDLPGTDEIITIGDIGTNIKSLSFWLKPDSTTELILEEVDNTGPSLSAGTMSYGSWDDCFVDGVNTDTITAAWHNVILTSTTSVDMSATRLGLVNVTYGDIEFGEVTAWTVEHTVSEALFYYNRSYPRRFL